MKHAIDLFFTWLLAVLFVLVIALAVLLLSPWIASVICGAVWREIRASRPDKKGGAA